MSKVTQIEREILALEGGAFQVLCDEYLYKKKGFENINSLGLLIGTNRVRQGTPDTFVRLPNGKFIFVEASLQEKHPFQKISQDLSKCFDEQKTGMEISDIQELIFCYRDGLKPAEEQSLYKECNEKGVSLSLFGIGTIAHDLYHKYPRLVKDHLSIDVDSGQIVLLDDFVAAYGKNKLAAPLDTNFHFREEELSKTIEALETSSIVIVSGQPGTGKSRLALEACQRFSLTHSNYKIFGIFDRSQDLFSDLRDYFSDSGQFLIMVDDANRVKNFAYFIDLLQRQRSDQTIKVVVTVRSYAIEKIRELSKNYGRFSEMQINDFNNDQIKQFIGDEYGIKSGEHLERIANIAHGNPRIAVMAAKIALETNLEGIRDVSNLYDEYFKSVGRDFQSLTDINLLKTAAIIAFFRAVDRSNEQTMNSITIVFSIQPEIFWNWTQRLYEMEVVDIYDNEVVKISDQVLATYLFYLAFFKNKVLDFSVILKEYFPKQKSRIIDVLNPIVDTFDRQLIESILKPQVAEAWEKLITKNNDTDILSFAQIFSPLLQTPVLNFLSLKIADLKPEIVDISTLKFEPLNNNIPSPSILSILGNFSRANSDAVKIALRLVFDYLKKLPKDSELVSRLLTKEYGYSRFIYRRSVDVQKIVIESLWEEADDGRNVLFTKLFMMIALNYLYTNINSNEFKSTGVLTTYNFQVPTRKDVLELRPSIFEKIFSLYQNQNYQEDVLKFLQLYCTPIKINVKNIIEHDAQQILSFIRANLIPKKYEHDISVQNYLQFLEIYGEIKEEDLSQKFRGDTYNVYEVLFESRLERNNLEYEDLKRVTQRKLETFFANYTFDDFVSFTSHCAKISSTALSGQAFHDFLHTITEALIVLANTNPSLFITCMEYAIRTETGLSYLISPIIKKLIEICGADETYQIISEHPIYKTRFLFVFYEVLPDDLIKENHVQEILSIFATTKQDELPHRADKFLKYQKLNDKLIVEITKIILDKIAENDCPEFLSSLTNPDSKANKALVELFPSSVVIFKKVYLVSLKLGKLEDYDSRTLVKILETDPDFIIEYLNCMYIPEDTRAIWNYRVPDFNLLWEHKNYERWMKSVVEYAYIREQTDYFRDLDKFFLSLDKEPTTVIIEKQDALLQTLIKQKSDDGSFMAFLFELISYFSPKRRIKLIGHFLEVNYNLDDFQKLEMEPFMRSWSGSKVPLIQELIEFFESILLLCDTVELLPHRNYIEQRIHKLQSETREVVKKEFMGE